MDADQRLVKVPSRPEVRLTGQLDRLDCPAVVQSQAVHAPEEAELNPAASERLVERREDDLSHPGLHPPEDRSLEIEEHAEGELQPEARRKPRPGPVAPRRRRSGRTCL